MAGSRRRYAYVPVNEVIAMLTPREREVAQLLTTGASGQQIANRLEISICMVRVHCASIRSKLGAATTMEAAVRLARVMPEGR